MPISSKLPAAAVAALLLFAAALPVPRSWPWRTEPARADQPVPKPVEEPKASAERPTSVPPANGPVKLLRRQASPEEIARWISELGDERYQVRQKATKSLEEAGQPALKALAEAAKSQQVEVQQRARQLMDRIEINEATAPTLVRLNLKNIPVTKAVEELARQSRIKLELVPQQGPARQQLELKRVSLDLDRAPFWEALEKLCQAASLSYAPRGTRTLQLELTEVTPRRIPTAYSGPFRLRVTALNYGRNLNLLATGATIARNEFLTLSLDMVTEPHITVTAIGAPQLHEAQDDAGESLVSESGAQNNVYRPSYYAAPTMMQTMQLQTNLRPPIRPAATLKTLKGTMSVEVLAQRKPLIRVDNILTSKGKIFKGEGNLALVILQVQDQGGQNGTIRFALTGVEKNAQGGPDHGMPTALYGGNLEAYRPAFELTDAEGRLCVLNLNLNYNAAQGQEGLLEGSFFYSAAQDSGPPVNFTFYGLKRVRTNVPFEFQDVPLP